jgi:CDP-diacylglycerol--serine O-phosphatidyltransferase
VKKRRSRGVYLIPNLLTTGNLFSGFYAIVAVMNALYLNAAVAILVAIIFDSLDGRWARMTQTSSRFGLEYDSLADLVSFGVAPGLLIYSWALSGYGQMGWVAAFLLVACAALRLARFNLQSSSAEGHFVGLPVPGAAGVIASLVLMDYHILRLGHPVKPLLILGLIYFLAFLMVSTFRYSSFKNMGLWRKKPFRSLVSAVLLFILLAAEPQVMLFLLFAGFALSGLVEPVARRAARAWRKGSAPQPEEIPADGQDRGA